MSEVQRVRGNIMGERKILGNGVGGLKLLRGNSGILQDLPASVEKIRATVREKTSELSGKIGARGSAGGGASPISPLEAGVTATRVHTKSTPVVGGRSDGGGANNSKPLIGGS